jgi:hypothetical protein
MAGPLSGLGSQQVPLSSPFQPGQNTGQVRASPEQRPQENRVQPQQASAAQSQSTGAENRERARTDDATSFKTASTQGGTSEQRRGSVIDITV